MLQARAESAPLSPQRVGGLDLMAQSLPFPSPNLCSEHDIGLLTCTRQLLGPGLTAHARRTGSALSSDLEDPRHLANEEREWRRDREGVGE